jgi:DNA-binding Xre family transcriptional regulator
MIIYRIRELMGRWEVQNRQRLPLDELARRTGISTQVLSKMADPVGDYATSTRHLELLCRFFKVTPSEMVLFTDEQKDAG